MKRISIALILASLALPLRLDGAQSVSEDAERLFRRASAGLRAGDEASLAEARRLAGQARNLFRQSENPFGEAQALELIASSYLDQAAHEPAQRIADEMVRLAGTSDDRRIEAMTLAFQSFLASRRGEFERGFLLADRARAICAAEGDAPGEAYATYVLGHLYNELNQPESALVLLTQAVGMAIDAGDVRTEMLATKDLGTAHNKLGDHETAIAYLDRALELVSSQVGGPQTFVILIAISAAHLNMGHYDQAQDHAVQALDFAIRLNNSNWISSAYFRLGNVELARGNDQEAEEYYQSVLEVGDRKLLPRATSLARLGLGKIAERRGRLEAAIDQYEQAIEVTDRVLENRTTDQDRLGLLRQRIEPYQRVVSSYIKLHLQNRQTDIYARRAFAASERIRNRIFVEHLAAAWEPGEGVPELLREKLQGRDRLISEISQSLLRVELSALEREQLREQLERLEVDQDDIRRQIAVLDNRYDRIEALDEWPIERIQSTLAPGTAFVEYSLGSEPAAFVITGNSFRLVPLPGARGLRDRMPAYVDLLSASSDDISRKFRLGSSHALYTDIMAPIVRTIPPEIDKLIISPEGPLDTLPFGTLAVDDTGPYLIERYSISYLPAASALHIVDEIVAETASRQLLAFAHPDYSRFAQESSKKGFFEGRDFSLTPLPYTMKEIEAITEILGEEGADVFHGSDASEDRIKSLDLTRYRIIHFATHGLASARHPDRSALVLALDPQESEDGFLQVREIYDLHLNADLVVLSACQTGRGSGTFGEGIQGLSRAFLFAGARSLVASMWKVEDEATAVLMGSFYHYLSQGFSKAESLRKAKISLIESEKFEPRQWAAFVLFGDADTPVGVTTNFSTSPPATLIAALLLAMAIVLIYIASRQFPNKSPAG